MENGETDPLGTSFIPSFFSQSSATLHKMRAILNSRPPSPCLSSSSLCTIHHFSSSFLFSFRPSKRIHFLSPCSSLRQTKKRQVRKSDTPDNALSGGSINWLFNPKSADYSGGGDKNEEDSRLEGDTALKGTLLGGVLLLGVVGGIGSVGYIYKDQINVFLNQFSTFIEASYGPVGYALFVAVYAGLEVLAIPAIPLTMLAGLLFGYVIGTIIVSISEKERKMEKAGSGKTKQRTNSPTRTRPTCFSGYTLFMEEFFSQKEDKQKGKAKDKQKTKVNKVQNFQKANLKVREA